MSITLTERAAEKIREVFARHNLPDSACLRISVKGGGCEEFSYAMDATDGPTAEDELFTSRGVRLVCDPKSLRLLDGTEIDYSDAMVKGGFAFRNPNAKTSCNCGSSFSA